MSFLSVYAGGGSVCYVLGGSSCLYEFVLSGITFVWKNWRGLRYGNFYVGGTNFGNFCMLRQCHYHLWGMFVCVQFDWCVWCTLLVVIRVHGICLSEVFAYKRSSSGGRYLRFLR